MDKYLERLGSENEEVHVLNLTERMLRVSLDDQNTLRAAVGDITICRAMDQLKDGVRVFVGDLLDEVLSSADLIGLAEVVRPFGDLPRVVQARGLAEGLDQAQGTRFFDTLRDRAALLQRPWVVGPGEAIPKSSPHLRALMGRGLNTRPSSLGFRPRVLDHLRLSPADSMGLAIRVDFASEELGKLMEEPLRVGVILPNADVSELDLETWTEEGAGEGRFFWVRPKHPERQLSSLTEMLEQVEAAGARAAVFPELAATPAIVDALARWMRAPDRRLRLLVAGSMHVEDEATGRRDNVVEVLGRKGSLLTHRKFNPFQFGPFTEDIRTSDASITLLMDPACSFTTLICKDLLDPGVDELLCGLGLDLLLAPSWSPKTQAFRARAMKLSTDAQAVVVIATLAASADPTNEEEPEPAWGLASVPARLGSMFEARGDVLRIPTALVFDTSEPDQSEEWTRWD